MNKRKSVIFATFLSIMQCFLFAESKADHSLHSMDNPSQPLCHWEYSFENHPDVDKWYWVSFPVLDTQDQIANRACNVFKALTHVHFSEENTCIPTYLHEICWMNQGYMSNIHWSWFSNDWTGTIYTHTVTPTQGYKINLMPQVSHKHPVSTAIRLTGSKAPGDLEFTIYGRTQNWLGYFLEESQMPESALAPIWDDVLVVKSKNWCLMRSAETGKMLGISHPLNFGDMLVVITGNKHDFQWDLHCATEPYRKTEPHYFVYHERQDYVPLYIKLPHPVIQEVKEIGLYVNGACKGAVVVEDSLEQISAYIDKQDELIHGKIDLVLYYKEDITPSNQLGILTLKPDRFQLRYALAGSSYPYYELELHQEEMGNMIPPEFSLRQNYPNPFNPSTTIAYSLPEANQVRIEIYNVKGQLVKTLLNKDMEAGLHSIIWNGRDMNNQSVASGIYFYRLSSPSMTQTKRMLLMK